MDIPGPVRPTEDASPTSSSHAPEAPQEAPASGWSYTQQTDDTSVASGAVTTAPVDPVTWTSLEYQATNKTVAWYLVGTLAAIVAAVLAYIFTKDIVSALVILTVIALLLVNAARRPRSQNCQVNQSGIQIGTRFHPYSQFKAFTIDSAGVEPSLVLLPLKRFTPIISVLFPPDKLEEIIAVLQDHIPFEQAISDPVNSLMKRLRF